MIIIKRYAIIRDWNDDLIALVTSTQYVPTLEIYRCVRQALGLRPHTHNPLWGLRYCANFTIEEWETWFAFELVPAIQIKCLEGSTHESNSVWEWERIKPC
jgi:hypothetical protein